VKSTNPTARKRIGRRFRRKSRHGIKEGRWKEQGRKAEEEDKLGREVRFGQAGNKRQGQSTEHQQNGIGDLQLFRQQPEQRHSHERGYKQIHNVRHGGKLRVE
jgi:hypothetical protein